jgi:hypothetical protein
MKVSLVRTGCALAVIVSLVMTGCSKSPTAPNNTNQYGNTSNGYFTITQPAYGDSVLLGSTVTLGWTTSSLSLIGTNVVIGLYQGNNLVVNYGIYANDTVNTQTLNISALYAGSGTDYRFRISSASDPTHYDMSCYFRVYSGYSGTFTVTNPPADTSWTVSTSSYVRWTSTGTPGTYVTISLYYESSFVYSFTALATTANGNYYATLPANLANGTRYRIMVSSSSDRALYAYSGYFIIQGGRVPDNFEYDGVPDSAKSITTDGVAQNHNLTYRDTDCVKFIADSGTTYTMQTTGTLDTYMYLYDRDGLTLITFNDDIGGGNLNSRIIWTCTASGTYYVKVRGFSLAQLGNYSVSVQ